MINETASGENIVRTNKSILKQDYLTYVEGVGHIPRDIYKYVKSDPLGDLPRYSVHIVIQHFLVFTTFIILAATGLPIYFSDVFWAPYLVSFFGGIDIARTVHRVCAIIMMMASAYHIITIAAGTAKKYINRELDIKRTQIPRMKDLIDLIHDIKFFLGIEPFRPKMEKFNYKQKLHYLAIIWGTIVLMTAGSALLFPDITAKMVYVIFGKIISPEMVGGDSSSSFFQNLARLMHADEAMMALIVVAFWHFTNVHLVPGRFPAQWTFLTGRITREHQIEEHFLEYINNLSEIPEEREYMKNLLNDLEIMKSQNGSTVAKAVENSDPEHPEKDSGEKPEKEIS